MSKSAGNIARFVWSLTAFALIALGLAISGYLLARHFAITGGGPALFDICKVILGGDCDASIRSDLAVQLGVPLAGWGVVHFAMVGVALALALAMGEDFRAEGVLAALALCTVATVLGAWLTWVMLIGAAPFCSLCVVVHVVNLMLTPVVVLASGRTIHGIFASLGRGFKYVAGGKVADPIVARWKVTGLVTIALVGIVVYQWILIQTDRRSLAHGKPMAFEQVLAEFKASRTYDVPLDDEDPRLGDRNAALLLVLFSDFQCPACRRFAEAVAHAREAHPGLAVVFKHYPLGAACNPAVRRDLHPLSCQAAYAAEAARRQGKFWEYHDRLFAAKEALELDVLRQLAQDVGLSMSQFEADLVDAATRAKVDADVALGKKLRIVGTPSAFLNKKLLSESAMGQLHELVDHESGHPRDAAQRK